MNGDYHGGLPQGQGLFHFRISESTLGAWVVSEITMGVEEEMGFSLKMTESPPQANSQESLMLQKHL